MNLLFYLTPKANCSYLYDDFTLRQAIERMEVSGYTALPILRRDGSYCGTLTEGDLLWAVKNLCIMDMRETEKYNIMDISHRRDNVPVSVTTGMEELLLRASDQNFVPVVDDKGAFIGIVTRRAILRCHPMQKEGAVL
ncbi:MAG: CBS domain-containing protein [Clostridiales bacterium]|nr:CBS domain-containing protein [Clostridiales bacterium]